MMLKAVISGDIIASTSINDKGKQKLESELSSLLKLLQKNYNAYSRIIKGDHLECYVPETRFALRVMLLIKTFIKAIEFTANEARETDHRFRYFTDHGIRLALGLGTLDRLDPKKGIIDGEAIYISGRIIQEQKTYNKEKTIIKQTLFIKSADAKVNDELETMAALLDALISKCTAKQCELVYLKLLGNDELAIAEMLQKSQSTINQHSTAAGWNAIHKAVQRFENLLKPKPTNS